MVASAKMNTDILKDVIAVISTEQQRRESLLADKDPSVADDQWQFGDMPFLNELWLMLLLALRHQIERELVRLAALASNHGKEISGQQCRDRVRTVREQLRRDGWKTIADALTLSSCKDWRCMEALRILANSYKHSPSGEPDDGLLKLLNLNTGKNYAPLPESLAVQEGLAAFIGLGKEATFSDIASRFLDITSSFLADVESRNRTKLSNVKWGFVSLNPRDFAH